MQCWEKLKARFPETEKEHASLRSYFRVLCFRAEAVSELVFTPRFWGLELKAWNLRQVVAFAILPYKN